MSQRRGWIPIVSLFPALYLMGWLLSQPLRLPLIGIRSDSDISLIGTGLTFILFLLFLPSWIRIRWGSSKPWKVLGLKGIGWKEFLKEVVRGLFYSFVCVAVLGTLLLACSSADWKGFVTLPTFINAIFLGIGVGFAEELIFRGWLWMELEIFVGRLKGAFLQAFLFSFAHVFPFIKSDLNFFELLPLLFGLFLLGLVLVARRILDHGSLGGCIGLHGGFVGLWFLLNVDLIDIKKDAAYFLLGAGDNSANPLGGPLGILCLVLILVFYRNAFAIAGRPLRGERNASSRGATP